MRKSLLTFAAVFFSMITASAQQFESLPQPIQSFNPATVAHAPQLSQPVAQHKAPMAASIITEQPAGKLYDRIITSYGGYTRNWIYGIMDSSTDAGMGKIVEGDDGFIYIYNLPTTLAAGSWVKAERAGGDTIVIERQLIDQRQGSDATYDYYLTRVVWEYTDQSTGEGRFVEAKDETSMKLLYRDGVLQSIEDNADPFQEGHYALGAVYTTDNQTFTWEGATNWNIYFEPFTDQLLQLPEGANVEHITVTYNPDSPKAEQVACAFVGNDVYLNVVTEGVYVKGTIDGDKLRFKSRQFVGEYYGQYFLFFAGQRFVKKFDEATQQEYETVELLDELVFDYNPADRSFKTTDALAINAGRNTARLNLVTLREPYFYFFNEVPATPADPVITNYNATIGQYGYNALQFTIISTDVDGNFMVPEKVTWRAWIDDEPFIFSTDDYSGLTEDMEEVPMGWNDPNYDIYTSFYTFFFEPAKNVGLQTIYRGGGEERHSNVVLYDLATSQILNVPEDEITAVGLTQKDDAQTVSTQWNDAAGRQVSPASKGFIIRTDVYSDGTRKSYKLIRK